MTSHAAERPDAPAGPVALERRVLTLWRIRAAVVAGVVALAVGGALVVTAGPLTGGIGLVLVAGIGAGLVWSWTLLVWRAWRFEVADDALELRHGVLTTRASSIPYHRVQHIDVEAADRGRETVEVDLVVRRRCGVQHVPCPQAHGHQVARFGRGHHGVPTIG